jgi:hypothetical protein
MKEKSDGTCLLAGKDSPEILLHSYACAFMHINGLVDLNHRNSLKLDIT